VGTRPDPLILTRPVHLAVGIMLKFSGVISIVINFVYFQFIVDSVSIGGEIFD
jgi:hypothetical protein